MNRDLVLSAVVALGLAGCTDVPPYRVGYVADPACHSLYHIYDDLSSTNKNVPDEVKASPCWLRAKEERASYDLVFVEFDDQGWVPGSANLERPASDRLDEFFDELERIYAVNQANGLSLVVYVHGWHHNASAQDSNVTQFRRLLRGMARVEELTTPRGGRPSRVVGIYVGWRGESVTVPGIKLLTYWDRKDAAERVAQGSVRELFARLHLLRGRGRTNAMDRNVRMLTIGHSFGGRIVFQALVNDLMSAVTQARDDDYVPRFADLVVMISPALESIQYEPLMVASQRRRGSRPNQFPVVIVATSTGDWATGLLFPITRIFGTIFEKKPGAQGDAAVRSLGHGDRYITHRLDTCSPDDMACTNACRSRSDFEQDVLTEFQLMRSIQVEGFSETRKNYLCGNLQLESTARWHLGAPFWVVSTTDNLMKDHNDFLNSHFVTFIRQMYLGVIGGRFEQGR